MSKYVLIPDSFKGTMSSRTICRIMKEQILRHEPSAQVASIPVADGGEGSVDCFLEALGGNRIVRPVCGPFPGEEIGAFYGLVHEGETAVIEMAACAGLPLVAGRADPRRATTFGVGQLMLDAADRGVKTIIIGLGGSASTDGGCGAAAACGVRFFDRDGKPFIPVGGSLRFIDRIDLSGLDGRFRGVQVIAMCDIDNPMYGRTGAAHIFGPQKGATPEIIAELDDGLRHLDRLIQRDAGEDVSHIPGAGAAGAMGAGMLAFFGAHLQMGIDTVLDIVRFERVITDADLILTGEGRIDTQSLRGKVVIGVARRAKPAGIPVIAFVGDIGEHIEAAYDEGVSGILSINRIAADYQTLKSRAKSDLALTVDNFFRLYGAVRR